MHDLEEWVCEKLGDLPILFIDSDRSKRYPKRNEFQDHGIAFLNAESISSGRFDITKVNHIPYEKYKEIKKGRVENGDIILTMRGNGVGDAALIFGEGILGLINAQMLILRADDEVINSKFLYYGFISPQFKRELSNFVSGSAQPQLTMTHLRHVPFCVPPLPEQKVIAHILGSLDDKIELNRQMNETLETMAQALFKSWFVDFDPVIDNALAAGNPIPDEFAERAEQRKGIEKKHNSDVQGLFPDEFEFTEEMGWIPRGWKIKSFSEIAGLDTTSVKPNSEPEKIWEHFSIPAFDINASPVFDSGESIKSNKYKVNAKAILVSKLNPETERIWWVNIQDNSSAVCSTEFMQFIPKNANHRAFMYSLLRSQYFQSEILSRVTGSTGSHQRTQPKSVSVIDVLKPSDALADKFSQIVRDWKSRVSGNIEQDSRLSKLRDTLLPKLMSGELRITDAATMVEEA